jgi:general secretion pathway protein A
MYEAFYGLTSKPFQLNPDPNFFFGSKQHRRAKAYLEYGVSRNEGFIVITGEIGAGKTTVLRSLIDGLHGSNVIAGHLVTTQLGAEDTLRMVGAAFGFRVKDVPKSELLITLEAFLISQTSKGKRCLLIVDEAQNLTPGGGRTAHAVELPVRQPGAAAELPDRPARVPRDPAAPRDGAVPPAGGGHLPHRPAGPGRDRAYVEHRLKCAGAKDKPTFDDGVFEVVYKASGGIPRRINSVCDRLLLLGFLSNRTHLTVDDVTEVAREFEAETAPPVKTVVAPPAPAAEGGTAPAVASSTSTSPSSSSR